MCEWAGYIFFYEKKTEESRREGERKGCECVCVCVCARCVVLWRLSGHKWPCDKKSYGICSCEFMQMVSISHIEEVNTFLQVLGRRKVINLRAP